MPPGIDEIVMRCLAKKPGDRFADAVTLAIALRGVAIPEPWTEQRAAEWWRTHEATQGL